MYSVLSNYNLVSGKAFSKIRIIQAHLMVDDNKTLR